MKAKYWILILVVILLLVSSIWWSGFILEKEPLYIAVSGPMSGKSEMNGKAMVQGIQLYLDKINQQGGIHDRPIKLLHFDDQNHPELAKKVALQITKQSQALAVIGHYTSSASLAAAPIYQKYGIPAISGSATADELTKGNDWYFRTIFNNSDQGALLANYVRKILKYHKADILFDEDVYGRTLAESFTQTAEFIGLKIRHQWHFDQKDETQFKSLMKEMIATLKDSPTERVVFFATHSTEAVEAIVSLRREGVGNHIKFIGADALSSSNFLKKLKNYPREQTQPGYYSDGTYIAIPFLLDIASEQAQHFKHEFIQKYQEEPMTTSALYYDAAKVIINDISRLEPEGMVTLEKTRQQVKDNLWQLSRLEDAVEGTTGDIFFDRNGDIIKSIPIGFYKKGRPIAAEYQFQLLSSIQNQEELLQNVLNNKIIQSNGKFMNRARVVYAGIDFNEISELNFSKSLYSADFFIWFRFKGDFDDQNIEFINAFKSTTRLGKPVVEQSFLGDSFVPTSNILLSATINEPFGSNKKNEAVPDSSFSSTAVAEQFHNGLTTRSYRIKTTFKAEFDFHDYPMDKQILPIYFRHNTLTRDNLIYVVDIQGMQLSQFDSQHIEANSRKFFKLGGWGIHKISFFQNSHKNDSTLGMPNLFDDQQRIEYSQFNAAVTIERYVFNFILKTLLPIVFLIALGYFSFFLNAFAQKLAIGINLILATSLFHLKLSSDLSNIGYVILMEYFFYLVYLLAIFIIMVALFYHLTENKEDEETKNLRKRLNFWGKIIYPTILFAGIGIIVSI